MTKSVDSIIDAYRASAAKHGEASATGDHRKANRHHDLLNEELVLLRGAGKAGEVALLVLLQDEDESVRCWAATHCLVVDEAAAKATLEEMVRADGFLALDAEMVLDQWAKGELKTP